MKFQRSFQMLKKVIRLALAVCLAAGLAPPAALKAQETGESLSGSLGLAVTARPEFEGSNRYKAQLLPVVDLSYGPVFLTMGQGLGLNLVSAPGWTVAPALRYRWARKEKDSDLLKGLGDLKDGVEAGGVIRWQPGPAGLSLKVFQGLGRVDGLTAELGADYGTVLAEDLKGSVGLSAMFADRKYNQCHFGITPAQADKSGYEAYDPGAGLKHVAVSGSLSYALTEHLGLGLWTQYKRLTGPAADSPLVERGSADQFLSALSVSFNF
jgi:outer membrane scaffolding protein for murein synthesis (MipA/OmpV family)